MERSPEDETHQEKHCGSNADDRHHDHRVQRGRFGQDQGHGQAIDAGQEKGDARFPAGRRITPDYFERSMMHRAAEQRRLSDQLPHMATRQREGQQRSDQQNYSRVDARFHILNCPAGDRGPTR